MHWRYFPCAICWVSKELMFTYLLVCLFVFFLLYILLECTYAIIHNRGVNANISEWKSKNFSKKKHAWNNCGSINIVVWTIIAYWTAWQKRSFISFKWVEINIQEEINKWMLNNRWTSSSFHLWWLLSDLKTNLYQQIPTI